MKTFQTQLFDGIQTEKQLFRQLFFFQIRLEEIKNDSNFSKEEVEEIIQWVDQLTTLLMKRYFES